MTSKQRHFIFFFMISGLIAIFLIRLIYLQVFQYDFFKEKSQNQLKRIIPIHAHRGSILDRDLNPLALTEIAYDVYALPKEIENKWEFSKLVADHLGKTRKELSEPLYKTKQPFMWIKRQVSSDTKEALEALNIRGLGFIKRDKRVYPNNELAAQVLGYVGIDNQGLSGLEYRYDSILHGKPGKIIIDGDPRGNRLISSKMKQIPSEDGGVIVTTIDQQLQFFSELYLAETVSKYKAKSGQVIVMDPKTGDILAMASVPTFNCNAWRESPLVHRKNIAVSNMFEPGSIFKLVTLAAVLEEGIVSSQTPLHVPETFKLYNKTIKEAHDRKEGESSTKTVSEILEESLNVGTTLLAMKLGEERFYKYMRDFGFGQKTGVELNGEARGILRPVKSWSGVDIGMMSFGQGIAVTGLQMLSAVATIANDGLFMKPRIVQYIAEKDSINRQAVPIQKRMQVISPETAAEVREVMYKVMERGTGKYLNIKGYNMGGKTGTAQKVKENGIGYAPGEYVASFIGLLPVDEPKVAILVSVESPRGGYYGSTVAGPVFKKLAERIIDHYNIPPSKVKTTRSAKGIGG